MPSPQNPPSIEVLGLYSPSANAAEFERFVREEVASRDPANFGEESLAVLRRLGREADLVPFTDEDRRDVEDELHFHLREAIVVEALVRHPDASFDVGAFTQPDPQQPESRWQVAWNEKFLAPDGQTLLEQVSWGAGQDAEFRVVFVMHFWKAGLPLSSSYGELSLPKVEPLPERLWRLAPYVTPD